MFRNDELRALRRLQRDSTPSPLVFVSERGSPFTTAGFARMIERAAAAAGLELRAHPHMLRHACGYALANRGHDTRAIPRDAGVWVRGNCCGRVRRRLAGRNRPEAVAVVGWVGCKKAPTALARFWPGWVSARRRQPGCNSNRAGWIAEESDRATGLCAADWALTAYDGSASDAASRAEADQTPAFDPNESLEDIRDEFLQDMAAAGLIRLLPPAPADAVPEDPPAGVTNRNLDKAKH
jgi:hypothetical protein